MATIGIADFSVGQTDYIANFNTWIDFSESWATEVETARGGYANLDARLDAIVAGTGGLAITDLTIGTTGAINDGNLFIRSGTNIAAFQTAFTQGTTGNPDSLDIGVFEADEWSGSPPWGSTASAWIADFDRGQIAFVDQADQAYMRIFDGTTWNSWVAVGGQSYITVASAQTVANNVTCFVDVSGGAFTMTLPASPNTNQPIKIQLASTTPFATNNLTIAGNGNSFLAPDGTTDTDLLVDYNVNGLTLNFDGTYWGWS